MGWKSALAAMVALVLASAGASAEAPFSFDATPGKLPKSVVPTHYAIELAPDLQALSIAEAPRPWTSRCASRSRASCSTRSTPISPMPASTMAHSAPRSRSTPGAETATLTFANALTTGAAQAAAQFHGAGSIPFGRGLFFVDYPTEAGSKRMISTQLEPADARRIFPCWDEPAFKATFALTVTVPQQFPRRLQHAGGEGGGGHDGPEARRLCADAEDVELSVRADGRRARADHGGRRRRHRRRRHDRRQGARRAASRSRTRSSCSATTTTISAQTYPLPKLDLIAVPGGFGGAMENWGGITFFESRLLFDPAIDAPNRAARHLQRPRARDGASMVRRSRHHGVVGQSLAQRRLRQLDAGEGGRAFLSAMEDLAQRLRPEAVRA